LLNAKVGGRLCFIAPCGANGGKFDLVESLRPLIADSSVIQAINNGEVRVTDYIRVTSSMALTDDGHKRFIGTFERRMSQAVTHPVFGYKASSPN
jgi:CRISP-associated protein Cas1